MLRVNPLTLWVLRVMIVSSIVVVVGNGAAIRIIFPEVSTNDYTFRPEVRIFNFINIAFSDAEFEATESIVAARNFLQLHHVDALALDARLHVFRGCIDIGVTNIESHSEVRPSP